MRCDAKKITLPRKRRRLGLQSGGATVVKASEGDETLVHDQWARQSSPIVLFRQEESSLKLRVVVGWSFVLEWELTPLVRALRYSQG